MTARQIPFGRIPIVSLLVLVGMLATVAVIAWAQSSEEVFLIDQPVDRDVYAAAREVNVQSSIDGDFVAAAQRITVDGAVTGDIIVAAQEIDVRSQVNDDLRAAGQTVQVTSPVAGHLVAAGYSVVVSEDVGDWAWLAGNTVEVLGDVGGDLSIRANNILINAEIDGNVELIGDELSLGPEASVRGDLTWRSDNEADISPEANIGGEFIEEPLQGLAEGVTSGRALWFTISVIFAVMVLFLLFSRPMHASADRIAAHPAASLSLGFAVLVGAPVLALILMFSPLNAWIGLGVLGIYLVVLLLGVLTGLFAISDLALRRFRPKPAIWQALAAIVVTVIAVRLLSYIPYLGVITILIIWLLGMGALCWGGWLALRNYGRDRLQQT